MTRRSTKRTCLGAFFALILATVGALILAISAAAAPPAPTAPWPGTGALTVARGFHTADRNAVLLGNGKLLVAGGEGTKGRIGTVTAAADLFDPATATWSAAAPLATARDYHSTTLLQKRPSHSPVPQIVPFSLKVGRLKCCSCGGLER